MPENMVLRLFMPVKFTAPIMGAPRMYTVKKMIMQIVRFIQLDVLRRLTGRYAVTAAIADAAVAARRAH